jgi:vitamin B12 transporter
MKIKKQPMLAGWVMVAAGVAGAATTNEGAQDKVVVTATRVEMPRSVVGSSVTVVGRDQLTERQCVSVVQALREVPGLTVVQSGGPGGTAAMLIRGAKSEQTLVLVDGVPLKDPAGFGRGADLSQMPVENIERIEILRGPQSTLYGADAIGGVVNIITKKGNGPATGEVSAEAGSFNTFNEKAEMRGGNSRYNYSVGASRQDSQGISSASERNGNTEKDGYGRSEASARLGWTPVEEFEATGLVRWNQSRYDYDSAVNGVMMDTDDRGEAESLLLYGEGKARLLDGLWRPRLGGSWVSQRREDTSSLGNSTFDSLLQKLELQNDLYLGKANLVTAGFEVQQEAAESTYEAMGYVDRFDRKTARHQSAYAQDIVTTGPLTTTVGGRVDSYDEFGTETTWRVAPVYDIAATGTRLRGSYGTGFKAPSLFQLYSIYGSRDLNPEKSQGWDAGVEQDIMAGALTVGVTYFENQFDDMIDYDFVTATYGNVSQAGARGVETFVTAKPVKDLSVRASYTYTDTEDKTTGAELLWRPRNKAALDASYAFTVKFRGSVGLVYVGERQDEDFSTYQNITLDGYTLVNLYASYDVYRNVTLFGRLENLFDEQYEEVLGYGTPGRAGYGGVKVTF